MHVQGLIYDDTDGVARYPDELLESVARKVSRHEPTGHRSGFWVKLFFLIEIAILCRGGVKLVLVEVLIGDPELAVQLKLVCIGSRVLKQRWNFTERQSRLSARAARGTVKLPCPCGSGRNFANAGTQKLGPSYPLRT